MLDPLLYQRFVQEARQALALYEQDALLSYVPKKSLVEELAAPLQLSEDQKAKGCLLVKRKYILRAIWAGLKHPGVRIEWAWRKPITAVESCTSSSSRWSAMRMPKSMPRVRGSASSACARKLR